MIDLSFLTDEEQEMILGVLKRDADLKKAEEQRIKSLQSSVGDRVQLKYLTGDWFYETKSRRHRDRIHGSDIIRASIRQRKPLPVFELSQVWADRPSLVNSENQDVFVPPELAGLMDEPPLLSCERKEDRSPPDRPQDLLSSGSQSPSRQRQNPFNSSTTPDSLEVTDSQLTNGGMERTKTPDRDQHEHGHAEPLTPQVSDFHLTEEDSGKPDDLGARTEDDGYSMVKVREWFGWSQRQRGVPQTKLPEQSNDKPEMLAVATSDDKSLSDAGSKNVEESHVSPKPRRGLLGIFTRRESPEASPVEEVAMSEEREQGDAISNLNTQSTASIILQPQSELPEQLTDKPEILALAIADAKSPSDAGSKKSPQTVSPKPRRGLLGIFRRRESKERSSEEDVTVYQHGTDTQTQSDETVETLVSSAVSEDRREVAGSEGEVDNFPKKLSNLKSFLDKESSGLNLLIGKPSSDAMTQKDVFISHEDPYDQKKQFHEDFAKAEIREGSLCVENILRDLDSSAMRNSDETLENNNSISQKRAVQNEDTFSSVECSPLLSTPSVDGTFIARPILIVDETDSLPGGLGVKHQEEFAASVSVPPSSLSSKQQSDVPEPHVRLPPSEQEPKQESIASIWKKENAGPRIMVDRPKEPSDSQTEPCSEKPPVGLAKVLASSQSDLGATESLREMGDYEDSSALFRSVSSTAVSTAKDRIEKDLGSTDKSQSRSYNSLWDKYSVDQQTAFNNEALPQERLLNPIAPLPRSRTPKLKDPTDDEVKRSPSKTCHPKALPREPTNYKGYGQDYSPLKAFPIDISPPSKECLEYVEKTTLTARQIKSPSHEAKQVITQTVDVTSPLLLFSLEHNEQYRLTLPQRDSEQGTHPAQSSPIPATRTRLGNLNAQPSPSTSHHRDPNARGNSEDGHIGEQLTNRDLDKPMLAGTLGEGESDLGSRLARQFVPQKDQYDVLQDSGAPQETYVPQCLPEVITTALVLGSLTELDETLNTELEESRNTELEESRNTESEEFQNTESEEFQNTESEEFQNTERSPRSLDSSRSSTPSGQTGASPGSYHEEQSPSRDLKEISAKLMASSKSLEDLTSRITLSVPASPASASSPSSLPQSEQEKPMGVSVPDLPQDQEEMSGSAASIFNTDPGDVEVKGTIRYALNYVQKLGEFHIFVVHCRELAVADHKRNRSDPYVKCYLLPDKAKMGKRKTSVKKKTLNPTYNEILRFKVTMETLKTQKLNVSVWHNDSFGRNNFLGQVDTDLSAWDFANTQMNDYALKTRVSIPSPGPSRAIDHRGEMRVALRFLPQASYSQRSSKVVAGEVQVWVKDCKNLPPVRGVVIDPFVKCIVLPDPSRKSRQKTRVVKRTASPMFNHTMVFPGFRAEDLPQACAELTVWDHDRLSNHFIGGIRIGSGSGMSHGSEVHWMDSTAEEAQLWERMMSSQSEWVEEVLPLRMLMMARGVSK